MDSKGKGPTLLSQCVIFNEAPEATGKVAIVMADGTKTKLYEKVPVIQNAGGYATIGKEHQGQVQPEGGIRFCLLLSTTLNRAVNGVLPNCKLCVNNCGAEVVNINAGHDKMVGIAINQTTL